MGILEDYFLDVKKGLIDIPYAASIWYLITNCYETVDFL